MDTANTESGSLHNVVGKNFFDAMSKTEAPKRLQNKNNKKDVTSSILTYFGQCVVTAILMCVIGLIIMLIYTSIESRKEFENEIKYEIKSMKDTAVHNNLTLIKEKEGNLIFFDKTDGSLVVVDKEYNLKKAINLSKQIEEYYEEERRIRREKEGNESRILDDAMLYLEE